MQKIWLDFRNALEPEIGSELADFFVTSLIRESNGSIERAEKLYFEVGKTWAPVLLHWRDWLIRRALYRPVLIMRDAKPLSALPISEMWQWAWLNRENCGIQDELSGSSGERPAFGRVS